MEFNMKNLLTILSLITVLVLSSCAKSPEGVESPSIKIEALTENEQETFKLRVSGGIKNENSHTALLDYTGKLNFIDPSDGGKVVESIPFKLPVILPFDSAVIDETVSRSEKDLEPLMKLLKINREELIKNRSVEKFNILNSLVKIDSVSYKTKEIIKLLKEKINEKN
jgi:hypothetical protein